MHLFLISFCLPLFSLFIREDEWLCAALDCLDFLSDQPVVELSRELPHCFPQDQESCDQPPAGSINQDGGNCFRCVSVCGTSHPCWWCRSSVFIVICVSTSGYSSDEPRLSPSGLAQCKLLVYRTLVKHYSHTDQPPLLPQHMTDFYTAVTDLLGESLILIDWFI